VNGDTADWTYEVLGVKYSYGLELRDTGRHGFLLPADQIIPTGEETVAGFMALCEHIAANP
jgi:carboxypeptidase A1